MPAAGRRRASPTLRVLVGGCGEVIGRLDRQLDKVAVVLTDASLDRFRRRLILLAAQVLPSHEYKIRDGSGFEAD